jgi:hypothetical protein
MKISNLNGYDVYGEMLVDEIEKLRNKNFMYKDITTYLNSLGYKSRRNKILTTKLVERMLKKKIKYRDKLKVEVLDIEDVKLVDDRIGMYCKIENGEIGNL